MSSGLVDRVRRIKDDFLARLVTRIPNKHQVMPVTDDHMDLRDQLQSCG
jgi:hypothetical protein